MANPTPHYAIHYGHPSHLESGQSREKYSDAVSVFTRIQHLGKEAAAALIKLSFDENGVVNKRELKKSFGLPVSDMTKVSCPRPELVVGGEGGGYAWVVDHDKLGLRVWENSEEKAIIAFWDAVKHDYGDVRCTEYLGEWYY